MRIFVTGGAGFIGNRLVDRLTRDGHDIVVLTRALRSGAATPRGATFILGDPTRPGPWQDEVQACGAAINLAGASLARRWTKRWKESILESRIATTRNLTNAVLSPGVRTGILVSASAVGYYGPRGDEELEEGASPGRDFLAGVTSAWEAEAARAKKAGVRIVLSRFGIVLGRGGGALGRWSSLFKAGLGGPIGNGRQWFSWIHIDDLVEAVAALLGDPGANGPFNVCAPCPVRNRELARALGKALHRPSFFPVPGFAARLVLGEFAESLLTGQRVVPAKLLARGFVFRHPEIGEALRDLSGRISKP